MGHLQTLLRRIRGAEVRDTGMVKVEVITTIVPLAIRLNSINTVDQLVVPTEEEAVEVVVAEVTNMEAPGQVIVIAVWRCSP